jgi:PAS domain S-box-containing protein
MESAELERSTKQEQLLALAVEHSHAAILITNSDGVILYANPHFTALTGYTLHEAVGNYPWRLLPGMAPEQEASQLSISMKSGVGWRGEICNCKKSGELYWVSESVTPIMDQDGAITHFVLVQEDITNRKRLEIEHQVLLDIMQCAASAEKLVEFIALVHRAIEKVIFAENFFVVLYNERSGYFEEVYAVDQYDPNFVPFQLGKSISAYVFRTRKALLLTQDHFEELMALGEVELIGTNSPSWLGVPLTAYGKTIGVMVVQDYEQEFRYTEQDKEILASIAGQIALAIQRKLAEQALLDSEARFRLLAENSTDMISRHDSQGVFLYVSPACRTLLGYEPGELVGKSTFEFIHSDDSATVRDSFGIVIEQSISHTFSFRFLGKDGEYLWVETNCRVIYDPVNGDLLEIHAATRDISARKLAELAQRENEARLRAIIDAAPFGAHLYKLEPGRRLVFTGANRSADNILHIDHQQFLSKTIEEAFPALIDTTIPAAYREVATSGQSFEMDHVDYDDAGIRGAYEIHAFQTGEQQMAVFFRDITERKRAEEALLNQLAFDEMMTHLLAHFASSSGDEIDNAIQIGLKDVAGFIGADHAYVLLAPQAQNAWIIRQEWCAGHENFGVLMPQADLTGSPSWIEEKIRAGASILINHISDFPLEAAREQQVFSAGEVKSLLYVPLRCPAAFIEGLLGIESHEDGVTWSDMDAGRLRMVGDAIANLLERQHAERNLAQQVEHLRSLRMVDQAIISSTDLALTLKLLSCQVLEQLHVDAADVLLFEPGSQNLLFASGQGFHTSAFQHTRLAIGSGLAGLAAQSRTTIYIPDLKAIAKSSSFDRVVVAEGFVTYLGVPLIAKNQLLGVLEIFHRSPLVSDPEWLTFLDTLAGQAAISIDNATLLANLQESKMELELAYDSTLEGWSRALDLRDRETEGHTRRVTELTVLLAGEFGLDDEQLVQVRRGGLLHDIGKMGIPDSILLKPGVLSPQEWQVMRKHPEYAFEMLSPIQYLQPALDIPYCHHERFDGSGYPRGLTGNQIPLAARIFAVVDVWDALTSDRPYRQAWSREKTLVYLREGAGSQFDPLVIDTFLNLLRSKSGELFI